MTRIRSLFAAVLAGGSLFLALPATPVLGATYSVDTILDSTVTACTAAGGDCTLRGAITNANASGAADTITFDAGVFPDIPSPVPITLGSPLPDLTGGNDTIDATAPGVIVRGDEARTFHCLRLSSSNNTIKGLQITDCSFAIEVTSGNGNNLGSIGAGNTLYDNGWAVILRGIATGNIIQSNRIGTTVSGGDVHPDGGNGVGLYVEGGSGHIIGGDNAQERNVISGNSDGIVLLAGASANSVQGNFIGTDITGTLDKGNNVGINMSRYATGIGATNNAIGGLGPGQGNLISGNTVANIFIADPDTTGNSVLGNIIGPDINGSGLNMSNGDGVQITASADANTIGPRNVISDNSDGVEISGASTNANVVKGNKIGTNLTGTGAVPNTGAGFSVKTAAQSNLIGGVAPGDGNIIAFNTGDGIEVNGGGTTGNTVRGNSTHSNSGLEINNTVGGNLELTPPLIFSTIAAAVTGTACSNCAVDIFSDASTDARFYEGSTTAAADGTFTFRNDAPFIEANVTATNTDAAGNSSELATTVVIDSDGDGTADVTDTDDDNDGIADSSDPCRVFPEDFDGFQDADGCPDPDNDSDGVCDAGQTSVSCTGADSGKTAFYPPGHNHNNPTIDCRNTPEDFDSFKDGDGCPEPDNDNDGRPDSNDVCPGNDNLMGGDLALGVGADQNHDGIQNAGPTPPAETWPALGTSGNDDSVQTFEDYDGILDTDGCHDSPGDDTDGDLFSDEREFVMGTNPARACAASSAAEDESPDPYPLDFNDDGSVTGSDLSQIAAVIGQAVPPAPARRDLTVDGAVTGADLSLVAGRIGTTCVPPGPLG